MVSIKRTTKLFILLVLTFIFFIAEISVGYYANSIALIADSFHMLSDLLSIGVALYAIKLAQRKTADPEYTYGWQRAEVLGALVNSVFLLALCFTLYIEVIQRFIEPNRVENPLLVVIVGSAGLLMNLAGLLLFHDAHHHHHIGAAADHHHHHASDEEVIVKKDEEWQHVSFDHSLDEEPIKSKEEEIIAEMPHHPIKRRAALLNTARHIRKMDSFSATSVGRIEKDHHEHDHEHTHNLNMKGVVLHIMGDALGSLAVIISGLVILLAKGWEARYYMDPLISFFITTMIVSFTLPLARCTCLILLQVTPRNISIEEIRRAIEALPEVISAHDFHVWQLSDTKLVASVHVLLKPIAADVMRIQNKVQQVLHNHGVHSTTVQPEFQRLVSSTDTTGLPKKRPMESISKCLLKCAKDCEEERCCPDDNEATVKEPLLPKASSTSL